MANKPSKIIASWTNCKEAISRQVVYWQLRVEIEIWAWKWKRWLKETLTLSREDAMHRITATRWKIKDYPDVNLTRAYERSLKKLERMVNENANSK